MQFRLQRILILIVLWTAKAFILETFPSNPATLLKQSNRNYFEFASRFNPSKYEQLFFSFQLHCELKIVYGRICAICMTQSFICDKKKSQLHNISLAWFECLIFFSFIRRESILVLLVFACRWTMDGKWGYWRENGHMVVSLLGINTVCVSYDYRNFNIKFICALTDFLVPN